MKATLFSILFLYLISFSAGSMAQEKAQKKPVQRFSLSVGMDWYTAYSQKKTDLPMKIGYPVFETTPLRIGAGIAFGKGRWHQQVALQLFHATTMRSDDGLDNYHLLNKTQSSFSGATLEHRFKATLLQYRIFSLVVSPVAGLDYQRRKVAYKSGVRERTSDINLFLGFRPVVQMQLATKWTLQAGFDAMVYLPYLNTGTLTRWDADDGLIEQTLYRAFYYRTRLHHAVTYALDKTHALRIGYRLNSTVGFANREPRFYIKELIHHRMERHHSVYAQYRF